MTLRFLLAIMHPRRLEFFLKSLAEIDYVDVLLAKNMELVMAQMMLRTYFLTHDYDYLILTSDDIELPYEATAKIMKDVENERYEIITGWSKMNPDVKDCNITLKVPPLIEERLDKPFYAEWYDFITVPQIKTYLSKGETIIPVWFVGWSLTAMSKKSVLDWTPKGWYFLPAKPHHLVFDGMKGRWCSSDLWYSYDMYKKGYQSYADLTVEVPHIPPRPLQKNWDMLLVGKEPPKLEFRPAKR